MHGSPDQIEAGRQARRLIDDIAQNHTLNGTIFGTPLESLLNNSLEMWVIVARFCYGSWYRYSLSKQLYEKRYALLARANPKRGRQLPRLRQSDFELHVQTWLFEDWCNEVGFDASNVTAICGISQSTKSDKTRDGEFIGEKGIDFKYVFKAADAV